MATVTSEIKKILKMKDAGILSGTESMKKLLEELQKQVLVQVNTGTAWDAYNLKKLSASIEEQISNFEAKAKAEADGQLKDMWGQGQNLVDIPLKTSGIYIGMPHIATSVLDTLGNPAFAFAKISGVYGDAFQKIQAELMLGLLGGKTPAEVAKAIGNNLTDPGIFKSIAERAEVITKMEMGRVFEMSADMRRQQASQYVPGLKKVWIHAGHPKKPRVTHLIAHGQVVPVDEPFMVGGMPMMHPKDPGAPIEEIMHCGCISIPWTESWGGKPDKGFELPRGLKEQRNELLAA